jgi:hypothetical protein
MSDHSWRLVLEGLEIVQPKATAQGLPTLRVVLACGDAGVDALLEEYVRAVVGTSHAVVFVRVYQDIVLRKILEEQNVHLVLIVLNNIVFPDALVAFDLLNKVTDLLRFIRMTANCPIVALWGRDYDRSVPAFSLANGANYFFRLPFEPKAMIDALDVCVLGWPRLS